ERKRENMGYNNGGRAGGGRLPAGGTRGPRAAPPAPGDGVPYPGSASQGAAFSGFTSRITQQPIGRAAERAAGGGSRIRRRERASNLVWTVPIRPIEFGPLTEAEIGTERS